MIGFTCPACRKKISVKDELAGKKGKCPGCSKPVVVPGLGASRAPTTATAEERTLPPDRTRTGLEESVTGASGQTAAGGLDEGAPPPASAGVWSFLASPQKPDELGRLGPYRVLKVLGTGGMGVVFKAQDPTLERMVALKAMLPSYAVNANAKERFFREAKAAAALKHPYIVTIFQVGEDRGAPFLAMEFLEGESLDDAVKREGKLALTDAVRIARQVAEGLAAAHAKGLIHRDIKPANIWLETTAEASGQRPVAGKDGPPTTGDGGTATVHVKILDFGLARAMGDQAHLTQSGAIIGTPAYMAPEQAGGRKSDHRADLFSLGCVLYRMIAGERPFKGEDTISILSALALETPPAPADVADGVPQALSDLVMRMLEKDPEDRPASAVEVVEELRQFEQLPRAAKVTDVRRSSKREGHERTVAVQPRAAPGRQRRRVAPWLIGGAVFLLATTGLIAFLLLYHRDKSSSREAVYSRSETAASSSAPPSGDPASASSGSMSMSSSAQANDPLPERSVWKGRRIGKGGVNVNYELHVRQRDGTNFKGFCIDSARNTPFAEVEGEFKGDGISWQYGTGDRAVTVQGTLNHGEIHFTWMTKGLKENGDLTRSATAPFINNFAMEFVSIPKGRAWLGGHYKQDGTQEVEVKNDFFLGMYPVTQRQWEDVMGSNPSYFSRKGGGADVLKEISDADLGNFPVENVSWADCQKFIAQLNAKSKEDGWEYRMPTQAEWEYACRGGPMTTKTQSSHNFYGGPYVLLSLENQANFKHEGGLNRTCPVGLYLPNRLGLYDMHGNVWQWCSRDPPHNPKVPKEDTQPLSRGGSWSNAPNACAANAYWIFDPDHGSNNRGLRVARVPLGKEILVEIGTSMPPSLVDEAWVKQVVGEPAEKQVELVAAKLMDLNPGFDGKFTKEISDKKVIAYGFSTEKVTNISPLAALSDLKRLSLGQGQLATLEPLRGLQLTSLFMFQTKVEDLSPLKDMPLEEVDCGSCPISDLTPLEGKKLKRLNVNYTRVRDIGVVAGMPLNDLSFGLNDIKDLSPLKGKKFHMLDMQQTRITDLEALRDVEVEMLYVSNIASLSDISPLKGKRIKYLSMSRTKVTDLSPLAGNKGLFNIDCSETSLVNLAPLVDTSVVELNIRATKVADLSQLKDMKLTWLNCKDIKTPELGPLRALPLKELYCDFVPERDTAILRDIKTLDKLNGQAAKEQLK